MPNRPIELTHPKYSEEQWSAQNRLTCEWVIEQGAMPYVAVHRALCELYACGDFADVESFTAYVSSRWGNRLWQAFCACPVETAQTGGMGDER
ncbi:MAG: hypothetical protein OWT28_02540 [Firmicutes bacterium]|nr:hypothetical protein [Bacillota bacterium]